MQEGLWLCTYTQLFLWTPNFLNRGKFIPKILRCFIIFASVGPHFSSQNGEIWYEDADLGLAPPSQILQKSLKGYTEQIYTKNTNFGDFGISRPTF